MSKKTKVEIMRDNFLKIRGGKLISIEAYILAILVFCILVLLKNESPIMSIMFAMVVGFVFPILVGIFKSLAWLAAILFSFIWASLGFVLVGAVVNKSFFIRLLLSIILFCITFWVHKNYSGLTFQGISKKSKNQQVVSLEEPLYENVSFCSKCGRRIRTFDGKCDSCDR